MGTIKKILIIAPFAFGYTSHIYKALSNFPEVEPKIIYLDYPSFEYRDTFHKIRNFLSKLFLKRNLKKTFVSKRIVSELERVGKQDIIFIIRPDILENEMLSYLKNYSEKFIAYYYDSIKRFPRKAEILPYFNAVYSYDKRDTENHNLLFLTNYIFEETFETDFEYQFFNISTNDYRLPVLEKLAGYLKIKNWSYSILVYNGSPISVENVTLITKQKSIEEVSQLIKKCKIIVEIQREEQIGLSFRIFEALGHRKKLITTNKDVINYDFYHPQNILVLDENYIEIPDDFVNSPYMEIDDTILEKYKVGNWVKPIFDL